MFYSQCLLSRKGPLGSVWVAAYCHKRLKKYQVTHTDIPFSVDKILLEGVPTITYRVLGYLLLGVVRIYCKKVEYLFDDCHEVLTNIKKAMVGKKIDAHEDSLRAPYHSITLPDCFELDAFDFLVTEDVNGCNVLPREEIMLKDTWKDAGIGNHFLDEYVTVDLETFSMTDALVGDVLSPHLMDSDTAVRPLHTLSDSEANIDVERLRDNRFSEGNGLNFEMFAPLGESPTLVEKNGKEQQAENKTKVPEMELFEIAEDQAKTEHHNEIDSEASTEKLHDNRIFQEECHDFEMFCETEEEPLDLGRPSGGNNMDAEQTMLPEVTKVESRKSQITTKDHQLFVTVNATPEAKFPDASGATTPESMAIITPVNRERARTPSKRKCLLDKEIVLPNKVLKESIHDSSVLVCKRMKAPHTVLDVWKACRIPKLSHDFLEPFTPCISLEVRFLLRNKKSKTKEPVENAEAPEKLDLPGSPTVGRPSEQTAFAPETPVQLSATATKAPEKLDLPGSPVVGRFPEQPVGCSITPIQCSTSMGLFEGTDIAFSDRVRPASSLETVDKEASSTANQEFDIDLMTEEMNSEEGDSGELNGWSVRTRRVARYLHRSFLNRERRREEGAVNLTQVLRGGRNKKESARLFYEILVLKTRGLVHVKQDSAYADIIVTASPRLDENLCT